MKMLRLFYLFTSLGKVIGKLWSTLKNYWINEFFFPFCIKLIPEVEKSSI